MAWRACIPHEESQLIVSPSRSVFICREYIALIFPPPLPHRRHFRGSSSERTACVRATLSSSSLSSFCVSAICTSRGVHDDRDVGEAARSAARQCILVKSRLTTFVFLLAELLERKNISISLYLRC